MLCMSGTAMGYDMIVTSVVTENVSVQRIRSQCKTARLLIRESYRDSRLRENSSRARTFHGSSATHRDISSESNAIDSLPGFSQVLASRNAIMLEASGQVTCRKDRCRLG